jgi:hypothetical protein
VYTGFPDQSGTVMRTCGVLSGKWRIPVLSIEGSRNSYPGYRIFLVGAAGPAPRPRRVLRPRVLLSGKA